MLLIILLLPLVGFLINGIFGQQLPKKVVGAIGSGVILIAFLLSASLWGEVSGGKEIYEKVFTWLSVGKLTFNFSLLADKLSLWMMLIVTGIGFLIHVYSIAYMEEDEGFYKFFAYLNLFIFSMLTLVMGANYLMMFFGWEGVGLCSYLLIGFWYKNKEFGKAAQKAFIMNRIGDLGLLLGLFLLIYQYGTLEYKEVFALANAGDAALLGLATLFLFIGAMGKSAQIPLYTWLPDAMAGPTPVSALIHAATMVTAGIYLLTRSHLLFDYAPVTQDFVLGIGLATSLFAAIIGLKQNDIKKILAYSTVSQLGLMFVALGVGAYTSAMFHVTTHAFFKALLFLGAGSVIHAMHHEQDIRAYGGLKKHLPITFWTMTLGTLAIIGMPPFSGFFSKDEILAAVYLKSPILWGLTLFSAGITGVYMLRMYFVTFFGTFRGTEKQKSHLHESPILMTLPLIVLAILSLGGGVLNLPHLFGGHTWMTTFLGINEPLKLEHSTEYMLLGSAIGLVILVLIGAWVYYVSKNHVPSEAESGFASVIAHKFYIDEFYNWMVVEPIKAMSTLFHRYLDKKGIDAVVNGFGELPVLVGGQLRKLQNGNVEYYLLAMVVGIITILLFAIK